MSSDSTDPLRASAAQRQLKSGTDYYHLRRRRRGNPAEPVHSLPGPPTLEQVLDVEYLLTVYDGLARKGGQAPGLDGVRYGHLSRTRVPGLLRMYAETVRRGEYRPQPARQVLIPKPASREKRGLRIGALMDRVLGAAVNEKLSRYLDAAVPFLDGSHAWRPKRGPRSLLAALDATLTGTGRWVLAIDDVRKAFDSVNIDILMRYLTLHLGDKQLLDLVGVMMRGYEGAKHSNPVGIPQGHPCSPLGLNLLMHHAHDLWAQDARLPWFRYGDNLVYACGSVREGETVLAEVRDRLDLVGLALKGQDGVYDLRTGSTASVLGFDVRREDDRLVIGLGRSAWDKLRLRLQKAHETEDPAGRARRVVRGWLKSQGPTKPTWTEADYRRLLRTAANLGFRELASRDLLEQWLQTSWQRWEQSRQVREGNAPTPQPGCHGPARSE